MADDNLLIQVQRPELGRPSDKRLTAEYIAARPELTGVTPFDPERDVDLPDAINEALGRVNALVKYASPELAAALIEVLGGLTAALPGVEQSRDEALSAASVTRYGSAAEREADLANRAESDWAFTAADGDVVYSRVTGGAWVQAGPRIQAKQTRVINAEIVLLADGVTDIGTTLQAYFDTYASGAATRALGHVMLPGSYYSSVPLRLTQPQYQTWDFSNVEIRFDPDLAGVLFEIGDATANYAVWDCNIQVPKITRALAAGDYLSVPARGSGQEVIGLRTTNLYHSRVSDIDVAFCTTAFEPIGTANRGNVYNVYELRQIYNCRVSIRPNVTDPTGWSNENLYIGGRLWNNWFARTKSALIVGQTIIPVTSPAAFGVGDVVYANVGQGLTFGMSGPYTVTAADATTITLDTGITAALPTNVVIAGGRCEAHVILPGGFSCNRNYFLKVNMEGAGQNAARMIGVSNIFESPRPEFYSVGNPTCSHLDGEHASVSSFPLNTVVLNPAATANRAEIDYYSGTVGFYVSAEPAVTGQIIRTLFRHDESLKFVNDQYSENLPQFRRGRDSGIFNDTPLDLLEDTSASGTPHGQRYLATNRQVFTSSSVRSGLKTRDVFRREHYSSYTINVYGDNSYERIEMFNPSGSIAPATRYRASGITSALQAGDTFTGADGARQVWNGSRWTQRATAPFEPMAYANALLPAAENTPYGLARVFTPATGKVPYAYSTGSAWLDFPGAVTGAASIDAPAIPANSHVTLTIPVTGALVNEAAAVAPWTEPEVGLIWTPGAVYAAGVVSFRLTNITAAAIDPAVRTWRASISKPGGLVI